MKRETTSANTNANAEAEGKGIDPVAKASWYAVEAFGNLFGKKKNREEAPNVISLDRPPQTLLETRKRIREKLQETMIILTNVKIR